MADPNFTRVNRIPYSWTSCSFFINGVPWKGVTAVDFEETREGELVHDAHQDGVPIGITSGLYQVSNLSFTFLRDSAHALMLELGILAPGPTLCYGDAEFFFTMQLFEPITTIGQVPSLPVTTVISGCRIQGVKEKQEVGSGALVTELPCKAIFMTRAIAGAAVTLWSSQRSILP